MREFFRKYKFILIITFVFALIIIITNIFVLNDNIINLDNGFIKKGNNIYYHNKIDGSNKKINVDIDTFKIFDCIKDSCNKRAYAKDKNNIYDGDDLIEEADPITFKPLNLFYAKDEYNVYYVNECKGYAEYKKIEDADPETFEVLCGSIYAKDKNNVYLKGKIILNVDSKTFNSVKIFNNCKYFKDKNNVYTENIEKIENADSETFEVLFYESNFSDIYYYAKDKNNVYCVQNKLENSDVETFVVLGYSHAKDKNNCYKYCKIVEMSECNNLTK